MSAPPSNSSYSARVELWLSHAGQKIPLTHTSSNYVITSSHITVPPSDAVLVLSIDGEPQERRIRLTEGISPDRKRTPYVALDVA